MDRNFKRALSLVLKHEGGWSDHPKDPGGSTMKGVTLANFRRYVKPNATKDDLRKITDEQIATVYRRFYWDAVSGADLPDGIDYAVFDFAVNSGPGRAAKYLQKVVGVAQDGKIGPATIKACRAMLPATVIHGLCDDRMAFLKRLKTWDTFGKGWTRRVSDVRSESLSLSAKPTPENPSIIEKEVIVPKPVVPEKVEKEVTNKTNWLSGGLGLSGVCTALSGFLGGLETEKILILLGAGAIAAIVVLVGGRWIVSRVKAIRREIEA